MHGLLGPGERYSTDSTRIVFKLHNIYNLKVGTRIIISREIASTMDVVVEDRTKNINIYWDKVDKFMEKINK